MTGKPQYCPWFPNFYVAPKVGTYDEWMSETFISHPRNAAERTQSRQIQVSLSPTLFGAVLKVTKGKVLK